MTRRKPDKADQGERPITADTSAKMLEVYAGMILDLAGHPAVLGATGTGWAATCLRAASSASRTSTLAWSLRQLVQRTVSLALMAANSTCPGAGTLHR